MPRADARRAILRRANGSPRTLRLFALALLAEYPHYEPADVARELELPEETAAAVCAGLVIVPLRAELRRSDPCHCRGRRIRSRRCRRCRA